MTQSQGAGTSLIIFILGYARTYIIICGAFFIPLGMIFIYRNVMQSCGFALMPMMGGVVELVSRAALAIVAAELLSYEGVCAANASAWCLGGIFLYIAYRFTMKKMERDKPGSYTHLDVYKRQLPDLQ